jgi:hypothetical protein
MSIVPERVIASVIKGPAQEDDSKRSAGSIALLRVGRQLGRAGSRRMTAHDASSMTDTSCSLTLELSKRAGAAVLLLYQLKWRGVCVSMVEAELG